MKLAKRESRARARARGELVQVAKQECPTCSSLLDRLSAKFAKEESLFLPEEEISLSESRPDRARSSSKEY